MAIQAAPPGASPSAPTADGVTRTSQGVPASSAAQRSVTSSPVRTSDTTRVG